MWWGHMTHTTEDWHTGCSAVFSAAYTTLKYTAIAAIHILVMKANISWHVIQLAVTECVRVFITVPQLIVTDGRIFYFKAESGKPCNHNICQNSSVYIYRAAHAPACRSTLLQKHFLMVKYKAFLLLVHLSGTKFL